MLRFFKGSKDNPSGPSFRSSKSHRLDLSGSVITFNAPYHSSSIHKEYDILSKVNIFDDKPYESLGELEPEEHPLVHCYIKAFSFYGKPLVEGVVADLRCRFTLRHAHDLAAEETLFNTEVFERKLREQLLVGYMASDVRKASTSESFKNFSCPHDWKIDTINGTPWVHLKAYGLKYSPTELQWHTPISDRHYMSFVFERHLYFKGLSSIPKLEGLVNYEPVDRLANDIMQSAQVSLSDDSLRCKELAEAEGP